MVELSEIAQDIIGKSLSVSTTEDILSAKAFGKDPRKIEDICRQYESNIRVNRYFKEAMRHVGQGGAYTFVDRVRLRVQPSSPGEKVDATVDDIKDKRFAFGRFSCSLPVHRDTWGSGISQQINWWSPLLPVDNDRTLQIYPEMFSVKVPNTSSSWDYELLRKARLGDDEEPYPQMPIFSPSDSDVQEWAERLEKSAQAVVVQPGDLVAFSGSHLHSSVPNHSSLSRFSTEWRTINTKDFAEGIGAENVDGIYMRGPRLEWFKHVNTGESARKYISRSG